MSYDIFSCYGLDKIKDSLTENFDYKDTDADKWEKILTKSVVDSDGFMTDYTWFSDGETHIFMFGDEDMVEPDPDYADWTCETEKEASEWFRSYEGFKDEEPDLLYEEQESCDKPTGNANFMNDGFERVYGNGLELED